MVEDAAGRDDVADCPFYRFQFLQEASSEKVGRIQDQAGAIIEKECENVVLNNVIFLPLWLPVKGCLEFHHPRGHPVP